MARVNPSEFANIEAEFFEIMEKDLSTEESWIAGAEFLKARLPTEEDRDAYQEWQVARDLEELLADIPVVPTADDIRAKIRDMDFTNADMVAELNTMLNTGAFHYIGLGFSVSSDGEQYGYRLAPCTRLLDVTKETDWEDSRHIYPQCILGLNKRHVATDETQLPSRSRGKQQQCESHESRLSTDSNQGNDESGFVFFQLGRLDYSPDWDAHAQDPNDREWYDTGYVVVVVITEDGKAGPVYIIYNFYPEDENGERSRVNDGVWGYLPGESTRRAGLALALSFQDLQPETGLHWADSDTAVAELPTHIADEFELVAAVRDQCSEKVIRQYVVDSSIAVHE